MTPSAPRDPVIRLSAVRVRAAEATLLDIAQLDVRAGERVGIVGPNGAGKSTLLRVLTGFAPLARGEVSVLGHTFGAARTLTRSQWRALRVQIGQVMQGLNLVSRLSARENVLIGASARMQALPFWRNWARLYPAELRSEADAALAALDLLDRADTRADRLSGGERQKVALARLILQRPRIVLADEPTAALDPSAARQACATLRAIPADGTLVSVVHQPELLDVLAERVIGVARGRVLWDLPLQSVDAHALRALYGPGESPVREAPRGCVSLRGPLDAVRIRSIP